MNVKIYALKKDGGKFEKAVDFNPALISLGETVQDVLANATFHEWGSVLVEFDYKEKGEYTKEQEDEAEKEFLTSEMRKAIDEKFREGANAVMVRGGEVTDMDFKGTPADSVAYTKPPEFK